MPVAAMTNRERLLATIAGEETDRFPVWLKMGNNTWKTPQPEPYRSMADTELLEACGCDLVIGNGLWARPEHPHVTMEEDRNPERTVHTWRTPDGGLEHTIAHDPNNKSNHPVTYPVKTVEDLAAYRWLLRDTTYAIPAADVTAHAERQAAAVVRDAFTMCGIGHSTLMMLVESICGPENTVYLLMDAPELFQEVLDLMHADRLRQLEALLPHLQADTFWLTENTSTTLISPDMFRRYSKPYLADYGRLVRDNGTICVHHMCGTLDALLEDIDELPAQVNEAYTTSPLGDVSLEAGRTRMPSKCLFGGTNATLWMYEPERIIAEVDADLAACPDRRKIILSSAGVLPPIVDFEKAKLVVGELKKL